MIYQTILQSADQNAKQFAVLVDPDKYDEDKLLDLVHLCKSALVSYLFVGGSLMTSDRFERTIDLLKSTSDIPVIIFPGSNVQISKKADAILLLSLVSGRNPEYLIGQHVVAAPYLKESGIEIMPTAYMLIEGSKITTANYMSNTLPIPYEKDDIAASTAMASEMLGMKLLYLDGGSGAGRTISTSMIRTVKSSVGIPMIVGGGVTDAIKAGALWQAGADIVVVGNAIEENLNLVTEISEELKSLI